MRPLPRRERRPLLEGKSVALIVNPLSAKGRWRRSPRLRATIGRLFPGRVHDEAHDKAGMIALARRLSLENDVLVVLGGDGTIADVMQGIGEAGRLADIILGIIPFGSGNALSSSLQIPKTIRLAIRVLVRGELRSIDLIRVGGRIANFVSVGATGKVTQLKSRSTVPGLLGHLIAGLSLFAQSRDAMEVELFDGLDDRGRRFEHKTLNLKVFDVVVNKTNHFGYSWQIAPLARINDGYLDVTLFDIRAYSYLLYFPLIYLGVFQKLLKHYKVRRIILRGQELHVQYNGETIETRDEVEMRVLPRALRVICPKKRTPMPGFRRDFSEGGA
jgi:diacylglycerol kinase family enzyme